MPGPAPLGDSHSPQTPTPGPRMSYRLARFAIVVMAMVAVWGWGLPRLGQTTLVREAIHSTQRLGINPSAIYYTDIYDADAFQVGRQRIHPHDPDIAAISPSGHTPQSVGQ